MRGARCPWEIPPGRVPPVFVGFSWEEAAPSLVPTGKQEVPVGAEIKARPGAGGMVGELPPAPRRVPAWQPTGTTPG